MNADKSSGRIAIVKDILHACFLPGGETLGAMAEERVRKRKQEAFDAVIDELSKGADLTSDFSEEDMPEFIDMALRLNSAIEKGTATQNLRLLAQLILGLKKNRSFKFDLFQQWASIVETLTRDELLILAKTHEIMQGGGHTWSLLVAELVPKTFEKNIQLESICARLLRTGLMLPVPVLGGLSYQPSPGILELGKLALLHAPPK